MFYYFRDENGQEYPHIKNTDGSYKRVFIIEVIEGVYCE